MATLTEKLAALNEVDLSKLMQRLAAARAEAEKAAKTKTAGGASAAPESGSADDLLAALEAAKKRRA